MKLRYLFSIILSALFFASCVEIPTDSWDNIKLSQTYVSIPVDGGSATIEINATEDWEFVAGESWPAWLTVSPVSGAAGKTPVTISADANQGREAEVAIKAGNNTQYLRVRQGSLEASSATCAEVNAGPDGKTYKVKGTVTSIVNTTYGNWYLKDDTGEVYVYGTLDKDGKTKNFLSLGLEVGDVVEIQGPKLTYGSTVELVDVTVLKITKAFAKILTEEKTIAKEGGEFDVKVAYKGEGLFPSVPEEYRSWVSIVDVTNVPGEPTKIEPNPADTAVVKVSVLPNTAGDRTGSITVTSSTTTATYKFTQAGSIIDATIPEFLAAAEDATLYRISGVIKSISVSAQYHNANVTIVDGAGNEAYLYRLVAEDANIEDLGLVAGDKITAVGKRSSYNGSPQMAAGCYVESYEHYVPATIVEFLAAEVSKDVMYRVSGTIVNIKEVSASYNNANLTIADADGNEVYIYRMKPAEGGKKIDQIGFKVGDVLTVVGQRAEHQGAAQMGNPTYVSHETAGGDDNTGDDNTGDDDAAAGSYSVSFADVANRTVFNTNQQVWAQNGVTVTNDKASSTNDVANYSDPARFYKGSALTVAKDGMKKIEFFCNNYKETYPTDLKTSITDTNATVAVDGTKVTVTFTNAVNTFNIAALAGQVRMDSLTVYTE